MKKEIGKKGEEMAIDYLKKNGYEILDTNYQKREGEIDLIAYDPVSDEIVFIEVKTRRSQAYGYPEEAVDQDKVEKIMTVGRTWLEEKDKVDVFWRIDIIAIELNYTPPKIEQFKNITT
ncbi:YraN family protein [Patescibacteria group bacterium]|nr:YraN family protein [Patescibacteria group bacterium]MBU1682597.1 YraN family protein [Patescibacteria group bacterium]MBU1935664.1 YraN family protein [Patescibacteria group bacterium]